MIITFLYSFVKIYIPPEKLSDVQSISGSVNYDPLKHLNEAKEKEVNLKSFFPKD